MRNRSGVLKNAFKGTDKLLFILSLLASVFGIVMVYSVTKHTLTDGELIPGDMKTMVLAVAIGVVLCIIISFIDYEFIARLWPLVGIVCIGLMFLVFLFGVAPPLRPDSRVWLDLKVFYFQPSELVKIGYIITFAVHLDLVKENLNSFKNIALLAVHALIPFGLVMKTGDAGSALVFLLICMAMLLVAGMHWGYFAAGAGFLAVVIPILWVLGDKAKVFNQYQKNRVLAILYPEHYALDEAYQQNQALNAMGSGGVFGKGLFNGEYTQNGAVPEGQNDMILASIGEELGLIGIIVVLLLLFAIIMRIIYVGKKSGDNKAYLMCCGTAAMIGSQAIINISMCIRIFPVIGITLPFFSAGGSSNLCIYIAIGLIMSIYRSTRKQDPVDFRLSSIATRFSEV